MPRLPRVLFRSERISRGLAGADDVFGERHCRSLRERLGRTLIVPDLQLETNFIAFLKGDVEIAGVENLAEFNLDGAKDLVLIEARADGLPDLSQQLVFLGAALRVVT